MRAPRRRNVTPRTGQQATQRKGNDEESAVQKCVTCQFYDRRNSGSGDGKTTCWGQCRRGAPMLHPVNVKSYMVEGVWPHVRDDDWCGEWKIIARRAAADSSAPVRVAAASDDPPRIRVAPTPDDSPRVSPLSPLPGPVPERAMAAAGSLIGAHGAFD